MKIGIISDIHGNLEALERVRDFLRSEGTDRVWCLGDIVGYGPNPNECVDLVWDICAPEKSSDECVIVLGNHDEASLGGDITFFNERARAAIEWTREELTADRKEKLRQLPLEICPVPDILLVHASPCRPGDWHYVVGPYDIAAAFRHFEQHLCFIGHSHYPIAARLGRNRPTLETADRIVLDPDKRYLINVGSVGQPRDRNPRLCAVILDTEAKTIQYCRLEYDIRSVQEKILSAKLPEFLALRLEGGF
jgi:predicted phosphodiesterase